MLYDLELAKKITGIEDEDILKFYIDGIILRINAILGYNIEKHDKLENINGINKDYVYVNDRPLNSITEVKYYGNDITSHCLKVSNRKVSLPMCLSSEDDITMSYNAGYEELPANIQLFIFGQVSAIATAMQNAGLKAYSIEGISYSFVDAATQEITFVNQIKNMFGGI